MKYVIDEVFIKKRIDILNAIILALFAIHLIKLAFSFLANYLFDAFGQEMIGRIKKDLFCQILYQPLSFFDKSQTGYLVSRINEVEGLNFFFSSTIIRIFIGIVEFTFSIVILIHLNSRLTFISLLILPFIYIATKIYSKGIRQTSQEVLEKGAILSRKIQESFSGADVVKTYNAEERERADVNKYIEDNKRANIKQRVAFSFSSELLSLLGAVGGFIILWYSGWDIIKGTFTLGSYIAFSGYLAKLYGPTQMLAGVGLLFQPAFIALQRFSELMGIEREEINNGEVIEHLRGDLVFSNVSFAYDSRPVLNAVSFNISARDKTLIIGPNGSGKSTLVKLIMGLYKPQGGEILIDGRKLEQISLYTLRNRISIVSQNTFLFNDTIWKNILYSRPNALNEEIEKAAKLSGVSEFVRKYENGYKTIVGEMGKRLSGGEKQKISIARAILKKADIMIFDEATTYLDKKSEESVNRMILETFNDKTCLIISHKKRDITGISRTIQIDDGNIVGTWVWRDVQDLF